MRTSIPQQLHQKTMANRKKLLKRFELKEFPQPEIIQLSHPVLFCHGYGAIGSLIKPSLLHDACLLTRMRGIIAFAPNVVPYAKISTRAEEWSKIIRHIVKKYNFDKINVIAHSMGGLDMRYALTHLDAAKHVESLTTVSTPHHGTFLAELILKAPENVTEKLGDLFNWFGDMVYPETKSDSLGSVEQLTRDYVREVFNPDTPDVPGIDYYSYSAATGKGTDQPLNPIYKFQNIQIYEEEGINDSFVSVESANWGKHIKTLPISHMEQIKARVTKERLPLYESSWTGILEMLADQGH